MAFREVKPNESILLDGIMTMICTEVQKFVSSEGIVEIEVVQDIIEKALMSYNYPDVAKAYIIYRHERAKVRSLRTEPDPRALSDYIHVAKYAKYDSVKGRRETYEETVTRVKNMYLSKFPQIPDLIERAFNLVYQQRVLPSMRSMQFAGLGIETHNARMYNCSFTLIDREDVFSQIFYLLLCGCGVGYSVQWKHIEKLPRLQYVNRKNVYHHLIGDTIEGWADAIDHLIHSYTYGGRYVEFNYSEVRSEGSPLITTGGVAPGHLPLKECIEAVRTILDKCQGRQMRPIECHDIICHIAEAVLSGGIRRSSLMCIFSPEDTEMIYCKTPGHFNPQTGHNKQREMANNSAALLRRTVTKDVFSRIIRVSSENYGDPGFFFTNNLDYGTNPCGEIGLNPVLDENYTGFSFCNLCEINAAKNLTHKDFLEAARAASFIGTLQASYTEFPYLGQATEAIARRDALLGVGITGMMDNPLSLDPNLQIEAASIVLAENERIAKIIGINPCARATTVKPSGTASLELGGVGSGIHPHHSRRYFRRVTANVNETVAQFFMKYNPHMVEKKPNGDLSLIFPVQVPSYAIVNKDLSAMKFIDYVLSTYNYWIRPGTRKHLDDALTHNVSCTVTVKPEELKEVIDCVWDNRASIAAMSFAPVILDKLFPFAPRESVTTQEDEMKWKYLLDNYKPVSWKDFWEQSPESVSRRNLEAACQGGQCEL